VSNLRVPEISVYELQRRLQGEELANQPILVDVREPNEWAICRLPGATLAPLSDLAQRGLAALPPGLSPRTPLVVYCHHGVRSAQVTAWLLRQGFDDVVSLAGGIDAWSAQIDPKTPRYY
jgi:rhodanese-related sulfurtransferase